MDRSADFEMPSPKRIRLQAPEPEAAIDPATPVEDTDDLYGTPLVQPHSPSRSSHVLAPALSSSAVPIDQKLFQLPGLGMLKGNPASSIQTSHQQPQASFFPETEQGSSTIGARNMELENPQVNGEQDSTVDDERIVNIQTSAPEHTPPIPNEVLVGGDDMAIAKFETPVSEVEAPVRQDVTRSLSELDQSTLDWHSSGTVIDTEIWLGGYSIENASSTALDSSTVGAGTNAEVWQDKDVGRVGDWHSSGTFVDNRMWLGGYSVKKAQSTPLESDTARAGTNAEILQAMDVDRAVDIFEKQLFSGAGLVAGRSEKTVSEKPALEDLAEVNKDTEEAEFELDSSPLASDTSSEDSTDTSSSDDSDADDYEMLSPAEQARRLMAEDGGSDGEGKGRRVIAEVPRTLNEKPDEVVPKPSVTVTEDMKIEELGLVDNIVENLTLIKANTSGEYQVLESGSLLCLPDRSVIGVVSETLGRVQQPYYSVRFTNATAIAEAGIEKGTKIFYVTQHSTTVFTQTLKAFKGSDASNLHDEEVGDDELEFSDDEAEAEHKRQIKQQRMAKNRARDGQPDGYSRGPQQRPGPRLDGGSRPVQEHPRNSAEAALNYDDADGMNVNHKEEEEGPYTPLARPSNLHEILSGKAPPINSHGPRGNSNRGRGDSRGGNRGKGDNRGGGGNRGTRGSERGGRQNRKDHGNRGGRGQTFGNPIPPTPQTNGFSTPQTNSLPPRPSPETIGYQRSSHQGSSFPHPPPQQPPTPSLVYQTQQPPPFHTHPGYPSQYPTAYNQSHFQQQPPHQPYPPYVPQQQHAQYHHQQPQQQSFPQQGYPPQFASQPDMSFAPPPPPGPQYPASLPPGAHINPNFFKQQGQASSPQGWQQGYNQQQQQHIAYPASGSIGPGAPVPNEARLQELLRGLGNGGGSS